MAEGLEELRDSLTGDVLVDGDRESMTASVVKTFSNSSASSIPATARAATTPTTSCAGTRTFRQRNRCRGSDRPPKMWRVLVPVDLDEPLVADAEVMRDLVQDDPSHLAA